MVELVTAFQKRKHRNCITALGLDGCHLMSGGKDSVVLLYKCTHDSFRNWQKFDMDTNCLYRTKVLSVDLQRDRAACGTACGQLQILDINGGATLRYSVHKGQVTCARWLDYDRHLVATTSSDKEAKVWDLRYMDQPYLELLGHTAPVNFCDSLPAAPLPVVDEPTHNGNIERLVTVASDRTIRLWNVVNDTHLAFQVPPTISQNVECCCMMSKSPHYIFAVGMDSEFVFVFSMKSREPIGRLSLGGRDVWVTSIRSCGDYLVVGTGCGRQYFVVCSFNKDFTECRLKIDCCYEHHGCVNDIRAEKVGDELRVFTALGTEPRLGRWKSSAMSSGKRVHNLLNLSIYSL